MIEFLDLFYQSSTNSKTLTQNGQRQKQNCQQASGRCVTIIEGGHQKSLYDFDFQEFYCQFSGAVYCFRLSPNFSFHVNFTR